MCIDLFVWWRARNTRRKTINTTFWKKFSTWQGLMARSGLKTDSTKELELTTLNPTLSLWRLASKSIDWVAYFFDILCTYENLFPKQTLFLGPTNVFGTLDVTCPCFLINMTPVWNSIFCMCFFRTSSASLFFGFVFDFFFCIWVVFCDLHFAFCLALYYNYKCIY